MRPPRADIAHATVLAAMLTIAATACTPLARQAERPARSSLGCIEASIRRVDLSHLPDSEAHCIAAGLIARYCSVSEAGLASIGKEIRDAFGKGDAEWRDLKSDRRGVACARQAASDDDLVACCKQ